MYPLLPRIIFASFCISLLLLFAKCGPKLPTKGTPNFPAVDRSELVNQTFYRWLRFTELPNKAQRTEMEAKGVSFLGFQGGTTYKACFPSTFDVPSLAADKVKSCLPIQAKEKLAKTIQGNSFPSHSVMGDFLFLNLQVYRNLIPAQAAELLRQKGVGVLEEKANNVFVIQIDQSDLIKTASLPFVAFLEPVDEIPNPE